MLLAQLAPGRIEAETVAAGQAAINIPIPAALVFYAVAVRADGAVCNGLALVRHDHIRINLLAESQTLAGRAGAARRVKAEKPRFRLRDAAVALRAGQILAEQVINRLVAIRHILHYHPAFAQLQRRFHRVGQPRFKGGRVLCLIRFKTPYHQTINHDFDVVNDITIELNLFVKITHDAVYADAREALLANILQDLDMVALLPVNHRRQRLYAAIGGHILYLIDNLLRALRRYFRAAFRAMRDAHARVQQAQVVVNLSDRADGRARIVADALLINRHCRAQSFDLIDVRLFHQTEKLTGVAAQALDIAALTLGEDGIESQR